MSKEIETTIELHEYMLKEHAKLLASLGERCSVMEKFRLVVYSYFGAIITILALVITLNRFSESIIAFLTYITS